MIRLIRFEVVLARLKKKNLMINPETRNINVPDSEKLFGTRQDMGVERKYFKCPRIVGDNIDLSEHRIFVNYVPSKQDGTYYTEDDVQSYWCKDLAVEGDYITFSWKLSENVMRKAGYIAFAVYAKVSDENGNLKTKWHTTIAIGNVLDTLPDGEEWITIYPDIVTQLLERMDEVEKTSSPETLLDRTLKNSTKAAPADIVGKLLEDIADLKYIPIDITKLSNNVGTVEMGTVVNAVNLTWTLNKEPESQKIDGTAVDVSARSKMLENLAISVNKTFNLEVTDERGAKDNASTAINFLNGVYYGVCQADDEYTSETILTLTRKLQNSRGITFTVSAEEGQHIVFAMPSRYGTPNFNVGGFDGGFSKVSTFGFTNASGYTESYDVYKSTNAGLGSTTVKIT